MRSDKVEGYVWCEYDGDVHPDTEDPHNEGPRYVSDAAEPELDFSGEEWVEEGGYFWYRCPGPHRSLLVGDETTVEPVDRELWL